ncbi:Protein of unknown function [Gryllus bimaculatus]|nr:Protein of unknown function [Gryllus bimaculatus]
MNALSSLVTKALAKSPSTDNAVRKHVFSVLLQPGAVLSKPPGCSECWLRERRPFSCDHLETCHRLRRTLNKKAVMELYIEMLDSIIKINEIWPLVNPDLLPLEELRTDKETWKARAAEDEAIALGAELKLPILRHLRCSLYLSITQRVNTLHGQVKSDMLQKFLSLLEQKMKAKERQESHISDMRYMDRKMRRPKGRSKRFFRREFHAAMWSKLCAIFDDKMEEVKWQFWHLVNVKLVFMDSKMSALEAQCIAQHLQTLLRQSEAVLQGPSLKIVENKMEIALKQIRRVMDLQLGLIGTRKRVDLRSLDDIRRARALEAIARRGAQSDQFSSSEEEEDEDWSGPGPNKRAAEKGKPALKRCSGKHEPQLELLLARIVLDEDEEEDESERLLCDLCKRRLKSALKKA